MIKKVSLWRGWAQSRYGGLSEYPAKQETLHSLFLRYTWLARGMPSADDIVSYGNSRRRPGAKPIQDGDASTASVDFHQWLTRMRLFGKTTIAKDANSPRNVTKTEPETVKSEF